MKKSESKIPTIEQQAHASYNALDAVLKQLEDNKVEIEVEETKDKLILPKKALELLADILHAMSMGKHISIVPTDREVTTQQAAEILGCSRPHLVKLLEKGEMSFTKIGRHRRIKLRDVFEYRVKLKAEQEETLTRLMRLDEELGMYDL